MVIGKRRLDLVQRLRGASLVAQLVKNPPKMSETWVRSLGSIPGLGRSPGEGKSYPLQYSWASLVARLVKNPPAMRETWVRSLGSIPGLERSPEEGKGCPFQYSGLENSTDCVQSMGLQRVGHD